MLFAAALPAAAIMMVVKGVAWANGPCSADRVVQSANSTLLGRVWARMG